MTPQETAQVIDIIQAAYHRFEVTERLLKAWSLLLADAPFEDTLKRAVVHCRTEKWPPSVSELLEQPGDSITAPEVAWAEVLKRARRYQEAWSGHDRDQARAIRQEPWSHPEVLEALDIFGGFQSFARQSASADASARARYIDRFRVGAEVKSSQEGVQAVERLLEGGALGQIGRGPRGTKRLD